MVRVKSRFIIGVSCLITDDQNGAVNVFRAWQTEIFVLREQIKYASQEFGASKKLLNRFVLIGQESDRKEEVWVKTVLLLFRCLTKRENEA